MKRNTSIKKRLLSGVGLTIDGAEAVEYGRELDEMREAIKKAGLIWLDWCEENLPFSARTANRLRAVYHRFKDEPHLLRHVPMSLAFMLAPQDVPTAAAREVAAVLESEGKVTTKRVEQIVAHWRNLSKPKKKRTPQNGRRRSA